MAISEEAQQKALRPYAFLSNFGRQDGNFKDLVRRDKDKYIESVLKGEMPIQIPLIQAAPSPPKKTKTDKSCRKSKSATVRFLQKCLYFKPKTFLGTQLIIAVLSATIGIWGNTMLSAAKHVRPHNRRDPVVRQTNEVATVQSPSIDREQILNSLNTFYTMYQSVIGSTGTDLAPQVHDMVCPTCQHAIQVTSATKPIAKCSVCDQAFQIQTNRVSEALVRQ